MAIYARRAISLDRRYLPGEEIPPEQLNNRARRLRDTGHIFIEGESMPQDDPRDIEDKRINPDFADLAPAAQEQVLRQQVANDPTNPLGSPSMQPTPQAGADILASATIPGADSEGGDPPEDIPAVEVSGPVEGGLAATGTEAEKAEQEEARAEADSITAEAAEETDLDTATQQASGDLPSQDGSGRGRRRRGGGD